MQTPKVQRQSLFAAIGCYRGKHGSQNTDDRTPPEAAKHCLHDGRIAPRRGHSQLPNSGLNFTGRLEVIDSALKNLAQILGGKIIGDSQRLGAKPGKLAVDGSQG